MNPNPFARLIALQSALSEADNLLSSIDAGVQPKVTAIIDAERERWITAKAQRDEAEREIKELAEAHPEWKDGESIKTPFGSVQFRQTTKLEINNPDATVTLIRALLPTSLAAAAIQIVETPRNEVLETLGDQQLAALNVTRRTTTAITVKPAKVDMGKETKPKKAAKPATEAANA